MTVHLYGCQASDCDGLSRTYCGVPRGTGNRLETFNHCARTIPFWVEYERQGWGFGWGWGGREGRGGLGKEREGVGGKRERERERVKVEKREREGERERTWRR